MNAIPPTADDLELIPNQSKISEPLFSSEAEYQKFRDNFRKIVAPKLERLREAHQLSMAESKQHWVQ